MFFPSSRAAPFNSFLFKSFKLINFAVIFCVSRFNATPQYFQNLFHKHQPAEPELIWGLAGIPTYLRTNTL